MWGGGAPKRHWHSAATRTHTGSPNCRKIRAKLRQEFIEMVRWQLQQAVPDTEASPMGKFVPLTGIYGVTYSTGNQVGLCTSLLVVVSRKWGCIFSR